MSLRSFEVSRREVDVLERELDETLFGEDFSVLDVAFVETRELVRSSSQVGGSCRLSGILKVDIYVSDCMLEDLDFLDKVLKRSSVSFESC